MTVLMDLSGVVDVLGYTLLPVTRNTRTINSNGVSVPGTPQSLTIQASVQPLLGRDLRLLPEGQRQSASIWAISKLPFQLADHTGGLLADEATYQGKVFVAVHAETWSEYGYHRTVLVQKEV